MQEENLSGEELDIDISSEYAELETVLVHRPGREIERVLPSNKDYLLFDDIPFLQTMQKEHDLFVETLTKHCDCQVLYIEKLLEDIICDEQIRKKLVTEIVSEEKCRGLEEYLNKIDDNELINTIFCGITFDEWANVIGKRPRFRERFIMPPIPNAYFVRDPAAIIKDTIAACKMHFDVRVRESIILRCIFKWHPLFKKKNKFCYGITTDEDRPFTVEGGDITVINRNAIAIGWSQRTTPDAIEKVAVNLFGKGIIDRVYEIKIPSSRAYMHLDTVFTIVGPNVVVVYPDVIDEEIETSIYTPTKIYGQVKAHLSENITTNFISYLETELGKPLKIVKTGDGSLTEAEREQWADGTNVLAISPNKVITYDRNVLTNEALTKAGVNVITVPGTELVRGRGGPRCMTLPIKRKT
ncbi:MAG: arginine deiminase family protein [Candidatus Edwardsbacteria bacterium]